LANLADLGAALEQDGNSILNMECLTVSEATCSASNRPKTKLNLQKGRTDLSVRPFFIIGDFLLLNFYSNGVECLAMIF
jgi:hypothetical protein